MTLGMEENSVQIRSIRAPWSEITGITQIMAYKLTEKMNYI